MKTNTISHVGQIMSLICQTRQNLFITGKAGTGKTTLLRKIVETSHKNVAVVAPTGIAALNAGGMTIHSFFQIAPSAYVPDYRFRPSSDLSFKIEPLSSLNKVFNLSRQKRNVIMSLELLIVDEVSMLRADLLDALDFVLKKIRNDKRLFGGVQVIFIGDLYQLPPVVKPDEWEILSRYYDGPFFFQATCLKSNPPMYLELKKIYRQSDELFISLLNTLRDGKWKDEDRLKLDKYVVDNFQLLNHPGYIYLTTHNYKADIFNQKALAQLDGPVFSYRAEIEGSFPDYIFPMDETLSLKQGAQVMFTKNDLSQDKKYYNGKIGKIKRLSESEIIVECDDDHSIVEVDKYEWFHKKYDVNENTKEIEETVLGSFVHYPIKLAWAITIHKSQGLTFDKAVLDVENVFQPGQAYVALSRLRSLDGLVLTKKFDSPALSVSQEVKSLSKSEPDADMLDKMIQTGSQEYIITELKSIFSLDEIHKNWSALLALVKEKTKQSITLPEATKMSEIQSFFDQLPSTQSGFTQWVRIFFSSHQERQILATKTENAYRYYFDFLDPLVKQCWTWLFEIQKTSGDKTITEALFGLQENMIEKVLSMYKVSKLLNDWSLEKEWSKESYKDDFYKNYKRDVIEFVRQKAGVTAIPKPKKPGKYSDGGSKKPAKEKIPSHEITFTLWKQNKSLMEIAKERLVTLTTIENHFAKLIETGKVRVDEILEKDKIAFIQQKLEKYSGPDGLTDVKNYLGDSVSYGELRLYRAGKVK